jgi:hypothetical protein
MNSRYERKIRPGYLNYIVTKKFTKEGTLGPSVGCGGSGSSSNYEPRYESNSNPLNDILNNFLGN